MVELSSDSEGNQETLIGESSYVDVTSLCSLSSLELMLSVEVQLTGLDRKSCCVGNACSVSSWRWERKCVDHRDRFGKTSA